MYLKHSVRPSVVLAPGVFRNRQVHISYCVDASCTRTTYCFAYMISVEQDVSTRMRFSVAVVEQIT
jgi:hypothetical protein